RDEPCYKVGLLLSHCGCVFSRQIVEFILKGNYLYILCLTAYRAHITYIPILAPEGCLLEHRPEDGARSGVPRRAAGNLSAGGLGPPPSGHYARGARASLTDPDASPVRESAPGPKSPRWSAERRASLAEGREAPRQRLACPKHAERVPRKHPT